VSPSSSLLLPAALLLLLLPAALLLLLPCKPSSKLLLLLAELMQMASAYASILGANVRTCEHVSSTKKHEQPDLLSAGCE
jgi:hypothetical protein